MHFLQAWSVDNPLLLTRHFVWRRQGLPSSWATPIIRLHMLFDSGETVRSRPGDARSVKFGTTAWPPRGERQRLSQCDTFEAQSHGFRTGCLRFVTIVTSRNARLASGRRSNATGQASHLQGHFRGFQIHVMSIFLPRQASWRNPRLILSVAEASPQQSWQLIHGFRHF